MIPFQEAVIQELGVRPSINVAEEAERRISFLANYLQSSGCTSYVLGISGGIDSTTAGRLAQLACERLMANGYTAKFIAVRLPYGIQRDEEDAQEALDFINPTFIETVDIQPASDAMMSGLCIGGTDEHEDFVLGNIKARQRMVAQYALAGATKGIVIGTDNAAEALMGFFTKHGDGACDVTPLAGLNKRQVRAIGAYLGAPEKLVKKVPTADRMA
jgi:NAD+ synthase